VKELNKSVVYLYMRGCKMRVKYANISITEDLVKIIDEYLEKSKEGYRSRAEFISEAIRLRLGIAKLKK
jgi:metal-responsive CopG/Arc/MetJ family transcriptional regulator